MEYPSFDLMGYLSSDFEYSLSPFIFFCYGVVTDFALVLGYSSLTTGLAAIYVPFVRGSPLHWPRDLTMVGSSSHVQRFSTGKIVAGILGSI